MKITTSFLHLEHTPSLDQKIQESSKKLEKYFLDKGNLKWSCFVKNGEHVAEVTYIAPNCEYHASATTEIMYSSIDQAMEKIEKQAKKHKDKLNKMHRESPDLIILDPDKAWTDRPEFSESSED